MNGNDSVLKIPGLGIWTVFVVAFIMAPLVMVTLVSFTANDYLSLPTDGVSLRWYRLIAERPLFITAFFNSLKLAAVASATSLTAALLLAIAIARYRFAGFKLIETVVMSPLVVPLIFTGLAILIASATLDVSTHGRRLFAGHVAVTMPYALRTILASLTNFDLNQEMAARDLGASPVRAFVSVTLPQVGSGIFAGGIFAAIVSVDNVGISLFLAGNNYRVLPVELYNYAYYNNDPLSAAISVVLIIVSIAGIAAIQKFFGLDRLMATK